ncbi:hypothetical protein [Actinomadura madurae]|nr:hypothetical protein [Actinomadura madurae]
MREMGGDPHARVNAEWDAWFLDRLTARRRGIDRRTRPRGA